MKEVVDQRSLGAEVSSDHSEPQDTISFIKLYTSHDLLEVSMNLFPCFDGLFQWGRISSHLLLIHRLSHH